MRGISVLLAASIVFSLACSGTSSNNTQSNTDNKNTKAAAPTPTVPPPGSGVSSGQFQMGSANIPSWFPIYPGVDPTTILVMPMHGEVEMTSGDYTTPDAPDAVIAFYSKALPDAGYPVKDVKKKEGPALESEANGKKVSVSTSVANGKTHLTFSIEDKK